MRNNSISRNGRWYGDKRIWKGRRSSFGPLVALLLSTVLYFTLLAKLWGTDNNSPPKATSDWVNNLEQDDKEWDGLSIFLSPGDHISRPPRIIAVEWNITKGERRPDGVLKEVYLINGQFPGPVLEVRSGDTVVVTVRNLLKINEGIAMHWHGLAVSNEMDGVPGVTQCAIARGASFDYRLEINEDQVGTFWYHSHSDVQRADGLFGPLIVHKAAGQGQSEAKTHHYEHDQVLMIGDFYHRSATDVVHEFMDWKSFEIEPAPDSMLINGQGSFECSMAVPAWPVDCTPLQIPSIRLPASRTRLRIINTGSLTGFSISMLGYSMIVITVDGGNPVDIDVRTGAVGILYPGERVDVIVERMSNMGYKDSKVIVSLDHENMRFPNFALTPTQAFPITAGAPDDYGKVDKSYTATGNLPAVPMVQKLDLRALAGRDISSKKIPKAADKTFVLYSTITYSAINEHRPKGYINHTSWDPEEFYGLPLLALDRTRWPESNPFVPASNGSQWIDIVLNSMDDSGHPFHMHGNDFYVLAVHSPTRVGAYELYNPFDDSRDPAGGPLNLRNPLVKDTVYVPSWGYVVLRVKAENPGLWLFHCHILWHQSVGMAMAFEIGDPDDDYALERLRVGSRASCRR